MQKMKATASSAGRRAPSPSECRTGRMPRAVRVCFCTAAACSPPTVATHALKLRGLREATALAAAARLALEM